MLAAAAALAQGPPRGGAAALLGGVAADLPALLLVAGDLLWVVTYVLAARIGFRERTYALPMLAVALNFSWELLYGVLHPAEAAAARLLHGAWFMLDIAILFQLLRYGRENQQYPLVARHFPAIAAGTLGLAFLGQLFFRSQMTRMDLLADSQGVAAAYVTNLVMSVLFIFFLPARPTGKGVSLAVAWTKFLGTFLVSLGNLLAYLSVRRPAYQVQYREVGDSAWVSLSPRELMPVEPGLLWYLASAIVVFDLIYLRLVYQRRAATAPAPTRAPAPA